MKPYEPPLGRKAPLNSSQRNLIGGEVFGVAQLLEALREQIFDETPESTELKCALIDDNRWLMTKTIDYNRWHLISARRSSLLPGSMLGGRNISGAYWGETLWRYCLGGGSDMWTSPNRTNVYIYPIIHVYYIVDNCIGHIWPRGVENEDGHSLLPVTEIPPGEEMSEPV